MAEDFQPGQQVSLGNRQAIYAKHFDNDTHMLVIYFETEGYLGIHCKRVENKFVPVDDSDYGVSAEHGPWMSFAKQLQAIVGKPFNNESQMTNRRAPGSGRGRNMTSRRSVR